MLPRKKGICFDAGPPQVKTGSSGGSALREARKRGGIILSRRYMLDTNTASYIIKGHPPEVRRRLEALPMSSIVMSVVTQAELLYGLARKSHPANLARVMRELALRVQVLPWDSKAAEVYGNLRALCAARGIVLGALDMMIAAHAVAAKATLVTHDKAFSLVSGEGLVIEDWIK